MLDGRCDLTTADATVLRLLADRLRDRVPEAWERAGEGQGELVEAEDEE